MSTEKKIYALSRKTPYYFENNSNFSELSDYKIITKNIVKEQYNKFISDETRVRGAVEVLTSGSSGIPMKIIWNPLDYCSSLSDLWKVRKTFGVYPNDMFVTCHATLSNGSLNLYNRAVVQKNNLSLSKVAIDRSVYAYYYKLLASYQPKFMMLPPSFVYGLITCIEDDNLRLPSSIRLIELTGESCSEDLFYWLQHKYPDICWRIMYGMQEFNGIAYGTPRGLEVLSKNVLVEVVDDSGNRVSDGEEGNILVTGLKNTLFPLIRYRTEDKGYWDSKGRLHITKSRSNDVLKYRGKEYDGSVFWASILNMQYELSVSVLQFQVRKKNNDLMYTVVLANDSVCTASEMETCISRFLKDKYQIDLSVSVGIVNYLSIEDDKNKIKYFINEDAAGVDNEE